jgi:hypothetical protein
MIVLCAFRVNEGLVFEMKSKFSSLRFDSASNIKYIQFDSLKTETEKSSIHF